jgi:hypothetical protein
VNESLLISSPSEGSLLVEGSSFLVDQVRRILSSTDAMISIGKASELSEGSYMNGWLRPDAIVVEKYQ